MKACPRIVLRAALVTAIACVTASPVMAQVSGRRVSFDVPGNVDMGPTSLAADGKILGVYTSSDGHQHGFLLSNGRYQTIDFSGSTETAARSTLAERS